MKQVQFKYTDGTLSPRYQINNMQELKQPRKKSMIECAYEYGLTDVERYLVRLKVSADSKESREDRVKNMYDALDKYIQLEDSIVQVRMDVVTKDIMVITEKDFRKYDEQKDGALLDEATARYEYPEYFL